MADVKQKITSCLWFDKEAEEAANLYISIFSNAPLKDNDSETLNISRYTDEGKEVHGMEAGTVLTVEFTLEGQKFIALNAGPIFKFTEAISFVIECSNQEEIDYFWEKLIADGGEESQCGWLKDKFGLSWQVTPKLLDELIRDPDKEKADRVMHAILQMKKIDIKAIEEAANG